MASSGGGGGAGGVYELEVTVGSARDLKNVNWRYGDLRPYAVLWVDPASKCSTKVDVEGGVNPVWDEKLTIPLPSYVRDRRSLEDSTLCIDIVHAKASNDEDDTKPFVGSARLPLREVIDEAGIGGKLTRSLKLKRPSGRPQGKLEVKLAVKDTSAPRYNYAHPAAAPASYAQPPPYYYGGGSSSSSSSSRDYYPSQPQNYYYSAPSPYVPPPAGYPNYSAAPPPPPVSYGYTPPPPPGNYAYNYNSQPQAQAQPQNKPSKFGMGTGLAVGAAAGVLGGLALSEGIDYVEDKIADDAAEKVEDDLAYDEDF